MANTNDRSKAPLVCFVCKDPSHFKHDCPVWLERMQRLSATRCHKCQQVYILSVKLERTDKKRLMSVHNKIVLHLSASHRHLTTPENHSIKQSSYEATFFNKINHIRQPNQIWQRQSTIQQNSSQHIIINRQNQQKFDKIRRIRQPNQIWQRKK